MLGVVTTAPWYEQLLQQDCRRLQPDKRTNEAIKTQQAGVFMADISKFLHKSPRGESIELVVLFCHKRLETRLLIAVSVQPLGSDLQNRDNLSDLSDTTLKNHQNPNGPNWRNDSIVPTGRYIRYCRFTWSFTRTGGGRDCKVR